MGKEDFSLKRLNQQRAVVYQGEPDNTGQHGPVSVFIFCLFHLILPAVTLPSHTAIRVSVHSLPTDALVL